MEDWDAASDTPRTDDFRGIRNHRIEFREFARQLERELRAMTYQRDQLEDALRELEAAMPEDLWLKLMAQRRTTINSQCINSRKGVRNGYVGGAVGLPETLADIARRLSGMALRHLICGHGRAIAEQRIVPWVIIAKLASLT